MYCAIVNTGREGYREIVERNIRFARQIAAWMSDPDQGGQWYEVLNLRNIPTRLENSSGNGQETNLTVPLNVILFRALDNHLVPEKFRLSPSNCGNPSAALVHAINRKRGIYVSPGAYRGGAVRIAVSNWITGLEDDGEDLRIVIETLTNVMIE